jgi:hypothetical protein
VSETSSSSPLERALVTLIAASVQLVPDDLATVVAEAAAHLGGRDVQLLLVEIGQDVLCTLPSRGTAAPPPVPVADSAPGRALMEEAVVVEPLGAATRLWVPLLDSAERVGVLGTTVDAVDDGVKHRWSMLAGLIGELVVTKSRYGDALSRARRVRPVSLAAEMRWALLPPLTYTSPSVLITGIVEPAYDVGGDAFDYAVSATTAHVGLFDAMGHGLEASRIANLAIGSYRNSRRHDLSLRDTVRAMDAVVSTEFGDSLFATGQLAELDVTTGLLHVANAGHPPPVVFHVDGTYEEVRGASTRPIGLGADPDEAAPIQLSDGDVILFHTDGIAEARDAAGEPYGDQRLRRLVAEMLARQVRPAELLRRVVDAVLAFQAEQRDDATVLLLGWRPGPDVIAPSARQ